MPYLVKWSPRAITGIHKAYRFLANKDQDAAKKAALALLGSVKVLEMFPSAGRPAEDLEPEQRELLVPFGSAGYVILYHIEDHSSIITVLAVRHQKELAFRPQ